jgi:hypothetical protein
MSRANIGNSAVAPPNSTANKSSEIAPNTTGRERTKRSPDSNVCKLAGSRCAFRCPRPPRTCSIKIAAMIARTSVVPYTIAGPARYSRPPSAGPTTVATWNADEFNATARVNDSVGTRLGNNDCAPGIENARAPPSSTIASRIGQVECTPLNVIVSSTIAHTASVT